MKTISYFCALLIPLTFFVQSYVEACSLFVLEGNDRLVLGENYDFYYGHGAIFVNPSGLNKTGLSDPTYTSVKWRAKYSSVTFNQFGRELPTSGMNEKGLTVFLLWNLDGGYPKVDPMKKPVINELQWIQYQLDNRATTSEVLSGIDDVAIMKAHADLHYAICDSKVECALIEFYEDGRKVYRQTRNLPLSVTNNSYEKTMEYYKTFANRPYEEIPSRKESLAYGAKGAWLTSAYNSQKRKGDPTERAFEQLQKVSLEYTFGDMFAWIFRGIPPGRTVWSIVFDPSMKKVEFRTRENLKRRFFNVQKLSRSCKEGALGADIQEGEGNIENIFKPYSRSMNEKIIAKSFEPLRDKFPAEEEKALIDYPDNFTCN